jgi:hypothetical protein
MNFYYGTIKTNPMQSKLPEAIIEKINSSATAYRDIHGFVAYTKGASEWAQWKMHYDELSAEVSRLAKTEQDILKAAELSVKQNRELKARCEKMEAALEAAQKQAIEVQENHFMLLCPNPLCLINDALTWTDGHNTESITYIPGKGATLHEGIAEKQVELSCMVCGTKFMGPEPQMCCSGRDCACMGLPVDPIVCSKECYEKGIPPQKGDSGGTIELPD